MENAGVVVKAKNGEKIKISDIHFFEILEPGYQVNPCEDKIKLEKME